MGFLNLDANLRACGFLMPERLRLGGITFITHSGSAFSAMAFNDRDLGFNLLISAGQELNTTVADYLDYAVALPSTRAVGLFLETVRDPAGFRRALHGAERADVPIVALKVGRTERAKDLVAAHSGALAGDDATYDAVFEAHGVMRVSSLDEMSDTLELLAAGRRAARGGLASIHDSGGERALLVDAAAREGVSFARISEPTRARLESVLEDGLPPVNPLDAWGTGNDYERIFSACMRALLADDDTAALAFCVDLTTQEVPETGYIRVAKDVFASTGKPFAMLSNLSSAIDRRDSASLRAAGIPVLEGTESGLRALKHLFEDRDFRARPPVRRGRDAFAPARERWTARLVRGGSLTQLEALELVSDYGIPTVRGRVASDLEGALEVASEVGWPVALKTGVLGLAHKSDAGGVILGVADQAALAVAYERLSVRLGPEVVVTAMAPPGIELALGVVHDPQFGPLVLVASGGVLIELLDDKRFALPPIDVTRAQALLDRLRIRRLLDGVRGAPPADIDAVCRAIVSLSLLAEDLGPHLDALDINPVIAGPTGCMAVDALVVPTTSG
jgi:acyl-CoA synthetase (NDP forming)